MDRNKELFDRGLKNIIDSFERAREWADLSNCLQKVKKMIEQYKGLKIPRQRDLAKRLAQCLNPEINVIHQLTLEIYKEVFEREIELMNKDQQELNISPYDRKSSIALFFSGLFNFYQFAAFEVKQSFLDLIKNYILLMKKELILSLPGFMLCMLPALEDQNSEILKKVEHILKETELIVGTSEFYGEVWKAMLRTPRARLSAIRYLDKHIPSNLKKAQELRDKNYIYISEYTIKIVNREVALTKDESKHQRETAMRLQMQLHDMLYFFYPNKSKLVINALISGLSIAEPQVYVNRSTLDFLISHMPVNANINSIQENIKLVECASLAYTKKDFATLNKIQNWLFEHLDEDLDEIDPKDPTIITIVESQKNLFRKSMDVKYMQKGSSAGQNIGVNANQEDRHINNPVLILLRIMSDEQNTTVPILQHLSIHLIKFIRFHLKNPNHKFEGNLKNLLEQIAPYYKAVLESLAKKLEQEIQNLDHSQPLENMNIESIDLISFAIFDLKQLYDKLLSSNDSKLYLTQILSNLLKGMNQISNNNQNLDLIIPSLELVEKILEIFRQIDNGAILNKQKHQPNFGQAIESFNKLYVTMSDELIHRNQSDHSQYYKLELDTFLKYNNIMLQIIHLQNVDSAASQMPEWLDMLIQCSKNSFTKICLVSVDVFIKILSFDDRSHQIGGGTIMHIQRLIADAGGISGKFTDKVIKNPQNFKQEFLSLLQDSNKPDGHVLLDAARQTPQEPAMATMNGHDHCKEIIQNLWSILDLEIDTENIVTKLQMFDQLVPRVFTDVVIEDLQNQDARIKQETTEKQERAIKKFTIFWKFTASEYPKYKPFETEVTGKKYLALHNMINFLEDPDPTLRLSCRSWLSESSGKYNRIIDPLIEEFIKNSNFKFIQDETDAVIIDGDFETQYVIQNFGKLRNIILNSQGDIIDYMWSRTSQMHIFKHYLQKFQQKRINPLEPQLQLNIDDLTQKRQQQQQQVNFEGRTSLNQNSDYMAGAPATFDKTQVPIYLDILVQITLNFIRAEYRIDENLQLRFNDFQATETLTVNASACEFMELILKQIQKYPSHSNKIAHVIIKPLIKTFNHCIKKKNFAMQVNIINLLDLILNECNFQGLNEKLEKEKSEELKIVCAKILSDRQLIECIILGLKCDASFVRQKFIKFVEMFVPYMKKFTRENDALFKEEFKRSIETLIDCFCQLLGKVDVSFFSSRDKMAQQSKTVVKKSLAPQIENYQRAQSMMVQRQGTTDPSANHPEEIKLNFGAQAKGVEGDPFESLVINQESDIISIIGGLQCIINTCLDIKEDGDPNDQEFTELDELNEDEQARIAKLKGEAANKKTGFFSLFGGGETSYFAPDVFTEIKKMINDKLPSIFVSCIHCWNHLPLFNWQDYHFTRHGMFAYSPEDNRKIIEKMRQKRNRTDEHFMSFEDNLQLQINVIQRKIISILRPIAKKIPDQFVDGTINVWLKKSSLGNVDVNRSYEKLIQILICVYQAVYNKKSNKIDFILPIYQVINSMIKHIQESGNSKKQKETLVNTTRWTKNNPPLSFTQTSSETLLNSYLYSYLLYNPSMFDPLLDQRADDKIKEYQKTYNSMLKYFNVFKMSRNPFTVCWLLEVLNILSLKFNLLEARVDNRMRKEYHEVFNNMLTNCSSIISDTFNIRFHDKQVYSLAFPPTVYELLWRYEFIAFKQTITDSDLRKHGNSPAKGDSPTRGPYSESSSPSRPGADRTDVIASNGSVFFNNKTLRQMVDQKFEHVPQGSNNIYEQSVFKNMEILMKERASLPEEYLPQSDFMEKIKIGLRGATNPDDMLQSTKFFSIITLKQILCQLLVNLIGTQDNERTNKSIQIILSTTIQILQNDNKIQKGPIKFDQVMNQFVTSFFASIVENCHHIDADLVKPYRREIVDLFNVDTFFQQGMINLNQWQKIMKYFIDGKPDEIFEEQMQKWNFQGGIFANVNQVIAQKCYAMKRIAFLIFSCEDNDFQNQLDQLMKKMIEVHKQKDKKDIKQRLFLFFLTRVMLIRLDFQTLTEALRKLWPHLLNELISVFEIKQESQGKDKDDTDLTIEAIKLVELLSSLNIEDFQMNQWIFLIDGYGMQIENPNGDETLRIQPEAEGKKDDEKTAKVRLSSKMKNLTKNQLSQLKNEEVDLEVFKTFIVRFIGNQQYSFYNVETPQDGTNPEYNAENFDYDIPDHIPDSEFDEGGAVGDEKLKPSGSQSATLKTQNSSSNNLDTYAEKKLEEQASELQQSINDSNVIGNEFNRQEAEAKIAMDFINNDHLIKQN